MVDLAFLLRDVRWQRELAQDALAEAKRLTDAPELGATKQKWLRMARELAENASTTSTAGVELTKKMFALALCALLVPSIASAQGTRVGSWIPLGCAALPSMASAVKLSTIAGGIPSGATLVDIQVSSQNVNYTDDGTTPTSTVGLTIFAGGSWLAYSGNLAAMQLIQAAATATGYACFYK